MLERMNMLEVEYINRDFSWLAFNARVLDEATREELPLFERVRFLSIAASNLDEFFMVRVGSLTDLIALGYSHTDPSGLTPAEVHAELLSRSRAQQARMAIIWNGTLKPLVFAKGYREAQTLSGEIERDLRAVFRKKIMPSLVYFKLPLNDRLPILPGGHACLSVVLVRENENAPRVAIVQVPASTPKVLAAGEIFVLTQEYILRHVGEMFPGEIVIAKAAFRVTRNADLDYRDTDTDDLLEAVQTALVNRTLGRVTRLEISSDAQNDLVEWLVRAIGSTRDRTFLCEGLVGLSDLAAITKLPIAKAERFTPAVPRERSWPQNGLFASIRKRDRFIHLPYDSFSAVTLFLERAARDPDVVSISQTLYRVGDDSPVVASLERAARNGKRVSVLLEIKARFEEKKNIDWGKRLKSAGCEVHYGLPGLKTHAKAILVERKERGSVRRYAHIGTGNYNPETARQYTDMGIFTANDAITDDIARLFDFIFGRANKACMETLAATPFTGRACLLSLIAGQTENAERGENAVIFAKMNSVSDTEVIRELARACAAGVHIRLIVRGVCCWAPDGDKARVEVRSIVGRFLEHSRVCVFGSGESRRVYLSSADWMPRNFDRRVELFVPILDRHIQDEIVATLELLWTDTRNAWRLGPNDGYTRLRDTGVCAQETLLANKSALVSTDH